MRKPLNTKKALDTFGKNVVQQSRSRLTKTGSNFSKNLYDSIKYDLEVFNQGKSFTFTFSMADYGKYQDQGVRGVGGVRKSTSVFNSRNNKGKLWKQKVKKGETPFSYKEGVKPSVKHFIEWSKKKGLSPFAVREAVYHQGIPAKKFFTTSFNQQFKKLPDEIVKAFNLDLDNFLDFTT